MDTTICGTAPKTCGTPRGKNKNSKNKFPLSIHELYYDRAAFDLHVPPVIEIAARAALKIFPEGTETDDLVQYCLEHIYARRRKYRAGKAALKTWLIMLAAARLIDLGRANGRERAKLERFARKLQMVGVIPQV